MRTGTRHRVPFHRQLASRCSDRNAHIVTWLGIVVALRSVCETEPSFVSTSQYQNRFGWILPCITFYEYLHVYIKKL